MLQGQWHHPCCVSAPAVLSWLFCCCSACHAFRLGAYLTLSATLLVLQAYLVSGMLAIWRAAAS